MHEEVNIDAHTDRCYQSQGVVTAAEYLGGEKAGGSVMVEVPIVSS